MSRLHWVEWLILSAFLLVLVLSLGYWLAPEHLPRIGVTPFQFLLMGVGGVAYVGAILNTLRLEWARH